MKIVCAQTVLLGDRAFSNAGETVILPDREITRKDLLDVDALIVRSKTKVTRELLEGTSVKFVATATAGADHIDSMWLESQGIFWTASPGCNANSVSEYIIVALLTLSRRHHFLLSGKTIGVVGCGNVGSRVVKKCEALGMRVLKNDPPLATKDPEGGFFPLDAVLTESDIITLHTPLVKEGPWPTKYLADFQFFEQLNPNSIFINAARGDVCDYDALLLAQEDGTVAHTILDVWSPEPAFRMDVLKKTDIATPHIAGHSYEGKLNGTINCYHQLCAFFEIQETWDIAASLPPTSVPYLKIDCLNKSDEEVLLEIVQAVYNIEQDDQQIRKAAVLDEIDRAKKFDLLRKNYPVRREFHNTMVDVKNANPALIRKIKALGFLLTEDKKVPE